MRACMLRSVRVSSLDTCLIVHANMYVRRSWAVTSRTHKLTCTEGSDPTLGIHCNWKEGEGGGHRRSVQISIKLFSWTGTEFSLIFIINLQRYGFLGIVPRSKLLPAPLSPYRLTEDSNNRSFIAVYQTSTPGKTDFVFLLYPLT